MLAADKLQLQSQLKQQAVRLKEKEFTLHHENLMTVGTQAAVLAGLDVTLLIEFQPTPLHEWHSDHQLVARGLHVLYYTLITAAFGCNIRVVAQTTALSVLGAGLALRGPDGSMGVATDCLYEERGRVFCTFAAGLALTVTSLMVAVWLVLQWEAALVCWMVACVTLKAIWDNYTRVRHKLEFDDERETVEFRDLLNMNGWPPVLAMANNSNSRNRNNNNNHRNNNNNSNNHKYYDRTNSSGHNSYYSNCPASDDNNHNNYSDSSFGSSGGEDIELQQTRQLNDHHHHHRNSSGGRRRGGSSSNHNHHEHHKKSPNMKIQTV